MITFILLLLIAFGSALSYYKPPEKSYFDPSVLVIQQDMYLGKQLKDYTILTESGWTSLYKVMDRKPTILILAYYTCDSACPLIVQNTLKSTQGIDKGKFRVVVLSFDKRDSLDTLKAFKKKLGSITDNWVFGLLDEKSIKEITQSVGFKFFYSEQDKTFVHPNTLIFLSPDAKVMRYLFGIDYRTKDIELALVDAQREKPSINNLIDLALLACYRYDEQRSRYVLDPVVIFAGAGFTLLAITGFITILYKKPKEV